jgi:hypothetical protein
MSRPRCRGCGKPVRPDADRSRTAASALCAGCAAVRRRIVAERLAELRPAR